jgi:outer membrane autotransporter protein
MFFRSLALACRLPRVFAGALLALLAAAAYATPPVFTGNPLVATPEQSFFVVNLRQQNVITGTAPVAIRVGTILVNGQPDNVVAVDPFAPFQGAGVICLRIEDEGFDPAIHTSVSVQLTATNLLNQTTSATVAFTLTPGPEVDEQDIQQLQACSDLNTPPVANAGADRTIADTDAQPGENVLLDGSASTDADPGAVLTYQWFDLSTDATLGPQSASPQLTVNLGPGVHNIQLSVLDDSGDKATNFGSDDLQITVGAPEIPTADAGSDRSVADSDNRPGETVTLDGTQSSDTDGTIASYAWFRRTGSESAEALGTGATLTVTLPDGVHDIDLRVTDNAGNVAFDSFVITIGEAPPATVLEELSNLTTNQRAMARKLDNMCDALSQLAANESPLTANQNDLLAKCNGIRIGNLTANQIEALEELVPEDFSVARTQTLLFANTQYVSVMDRLMALRGGARGLSLAGLNIVVEGKMVPLAQLQDMAKGLLGGGASADDEPGGLLSDKWGMWARGNYSFGDKDASASSPSFDADQWSLVGGVDYRLSDKSVLGIALSYGSSSVEFAADEGGLDTDSWSFSLYGSAYAAKNFYFDGIVNVANASYAADRNITYVDGTGLVSADAQGDTDGMTLSGGLSGGYDFLAGGLTIASNLGFFYIDTTIDSFTEAGAGGLNLLYDEQTFKSLTGNLGLRLTYAWNVAWGVLLPHLRVDYVREFENDVDVFGVRFAADPNAASTPPILVETDNPDQSYWRLAAGFSAQFKHGLSGYIEYQRLASFEFINFQDVSIGLRMQRSF